MTNVFLVTVMGAHRSHVCLVLRLTTELEQLRHAVGVEQEQAQMLEEALESEDKSHPILAHGGAGVLNELRASKEWVTEQEKVIRQRAADLAAKQKSYARKKEAYRKARKTERELVLALRAKKLHDKVRAGS